MESENREFDEIATIIYDLCSERSRGPYKVTEALKQINSGSSGPFDRLLLAQDSSAWEAYFAVSKTCEIRRGFRHKTKLVKFFSKIRIDVEEKQIAFAKILARKMQENPLKRRRVDRTTDTGIDRDCPTSPIPTSPQASDSNTTLGLDNASSTESCPTARGVLVDTDATALLATEQAREVYVGAPVQLVRELFDPDFWESISLVVMDQSTYHSDVAMIIQQGYVRKFFGCQMEVGIVHERVAEYARRCFDVKIEEKQGVRYAYMPGGARLKPNPEITISGCLRDTSFMFKEELYQAVRVSPIFRTEEMQMRNRTDAVSMTISNKPKEGAKMILHLGEYQAVAIKNRLWC